MNRTDQGSRRLVGHRDAPLGRSPFGPAVPSILAALLYAAAALTWTLLGGTLPGGRWLAVHLFTLGVLTNLVLAFTDHFASTLTRTTSRPARWLPALANVGILLVLAGLPTQARWAVGAGATIVTAAVVWSYVRLRRMRKQAVGARFGWIVRVYERAHGAFIHGALLGLLMGVGALSGTWYGSARIAHLHINVLGWAGLTLMATLVFFGPTIVRTRIRPGADDRAAPALRHGATALTVAFWLLLATGVGGDAALAIRLGAAAAMAGYAVTVTLVCHPVTLAARTANPSAARWPVVAASLWFPLAAWLDVAMIATGTWHWLDLIGLAMLLGVLAQSIIATLTYLAPMLRARTFGGRDRLLARLEAGAGVRAMTFNLGVAAVVIAAGVGGTLGASLSRVGWITLATSLLWLLGAALSPTPKPGTQQPVSSLVARRYRQQPHEATEDADG